MPVFQGRTTAEAIENGLKSLNLSLEDVSIESVTEGKKGFFGIGKQLAEVDLVPKPQAIKKKELEAKKLSGNLPKNKVSDTYKADQNSINSKEESVAPKSKPRSEVLPQTDSSHDNAVQMSSNDAVDAVVLYLTRLTKELDAAAVVKVKRQSNNVVLDLETDKQGRLIGKHGKVLNAIQYLAQVYIHRITEEKISLTVNVGEYRQKREMILTRLAKKTGDTVKRTGQPVFLEPMPAFERKKIHTELSSIPNIKTHSEGEEPFRYLVVELDRKSNED